MFVTCSGTATTRDRRRDSIPSAAGPIKKPAAVARAAAERDGTGPGKHRLG